MVVSSQNELIKAIKSHKCGSVHVWVNLSQHEGFYVRVSKPEILFRLGNGDYSNVFIRASQSECHPETGKYEVYLG